MWDWGVERDNNLGNFVPRLILQKVHELQEVLAYSKMDRLPNHRLH